MAIAGRCTSASRIWWAFGTHGMVVYLTVEDQRRVDVLIVQWVG
jgi:hypothetical protein